MPISDPCAVCNKSVNKNQYAVLCDMCGYWVHIKCNNITKNEYAILSPGNSDNFSSARKCRTKPAEGRQNFADLTAVLGRHCRFPRT